LNKSLIAQVAESIERYGPAFDALAQRRAVSCRPRLDSLDTAEIMPT